MSEQENNVGSELPKIDMGAAIKQSFDLLKANAVLLIVTSVLTCLVSSATGSLLLGPMMMGMFIICDQLILGDAAKPGVGDVFKGLSFFLPGLVLDIVGDAGLIVCGIGTIVTMPLATWAMMRVADTGMGVGDALKDAWDFIFTKKQFMFIVVVLVAGILASLGTILCGIGVFVTLPLVFLVPACVYRQVYKK